MKKSFSPGKKFGLGERISILSITHPSISTILFISTGVLVRFSCAGVGISETGALMDQHPARKIVASTIGRRNFFMMRKMEK